jgi:DNA-binding LytR/AlgR family response regulator
MIRKKDYESIIIFVTSHEHLGQLILKRNIMCLTFINKFDDLSKELEDALKEALNFLNVDKILRIEDTGVSYVIRVNSILYVTTDSADRKTIIKTDSTEYRVKMTLSEVKKRLGSRFVQSYRSCFVNESRIEKVDCRKKTITFDNGLVIDLLSDTYRKGLLKC